MALKLLFKVGTMYRHPEMLISCVTHMIKHQIDISKDLNEKFLTTDEVYEFDVAEIIEKLTFEKGFKNEINSRISFADE